MRIPFYLLLVMGTIGSLDGIYYHLYKLRLFRQPSARKENLTHLVRGVAYAVALSVLLRFEPHGGWFVALGALFTLDLLDDLADIWLEPSSRAPMGGLPPREYLIHMVVMAVSGGIWTSYLIGGWSLRAEPTALVPLVSGQLPAWAMADGWLLVAGSVGLTLVELTLLVRHWNAPAMAPA